MPLCKSHGIWAGSGTRAGHIDKDLTAAPATPLVLTILCEGDSYGYAIAKRVRELSDGEVGWTDGMVYPLLHRLGRLGYLTTEWRASPDGRRRKYYAITDEGRAALARRRRRCVTTVRDLWGSWRGPGRLAFGAPLRPSRVIPAGAA